MKRTLYLVSLVFVLSGVWSLSAWSQQNSPLPTPVPRVIEFNGWLRDAGGLPLSGTQGVTIAVYSDSLDGSPLWMENQNVVADLNGHYALLIGSGSPEGLPLDLFSSGPRWLEVKSPNAIESPRVFLVSVPYALKAGDAETLGGRPVSAFVLADSNRSANGDSTRLPQMTTFGLGGTGSANKVAKWTDNAGNLGDSLIAESGNFVGVGTAAPAAALDVQGNNAAIILGGTGSHSVAVQGTSGSGRLGQDNNGFFFASDTNGNGLKFLTNNGALNEWMRITSGGNVGIGTVAPGAKLDVQGANSSIIVGGTGTHSVALQGTSGAGRLGQDNNGFFFASDTNGNGLKFLTTNGVGLNEHMRVTSAGNVGIGTVNPTAKLEVVGGLTVSGGGVVTGNGSGLTNVNAATLGGLAANAFGDITSVNPGTGLTGGAATGDATLALTAAARARAITYLAGCDTCTVLADADDQRTIYLNLLGPMTIDSVTCFSDAGTPSINLRRDDGTPADILSANLSCSTTGAVTTTPGFVVGESTLSLNDKLDFTMFAAGGAAHRVTVIIKATLN